MQKKKPRNIKNTKLKHELYKTNEAIQKIRKLKNTK